MSSPSNRRRVENGQAVDHISNLPETIICHILSFLPTKSAVKTSILSKRWNNIWTKVPTLDFFEMPQHKSYCGLSGKQKTCFRIFVDRALLHNVVSHVGCLCLYHVDDDFYMRSWLNALATRQFDKIDISFNYKLLPESLPLPTRLLSYESLVDLRLHEDFTFDDSGSLHLPSLEIVLFTDLWFPNDDFIKKFLSGCPVLKELRIIQCNGITYNLYVESLTLKTLEICRTISKSGLEEPNLPCLIIRAPHLMDLHLEEAFIKYDICDLNSLAEAHISLDEDDDYETVLQLLKKVSGVKKLRLQCPSELLGSAVKQLIFSNLTSLVLDDNVDAEKILRCAPKLKSLTLWGVVLSGDYTVKSESVPKCLSCLEHVKIGMFQGETNQMRFVAYFLNVASALKEMEIWIPIMERSYERGVTNRLLMLARSSSTCQVKIKFW